MKRAGYNNPVRITPLRMGKRGKHMITRITIHSESAYGPVDRAYKDRLTVTRSSVRYEYEPLKATSSHQPEKWTVTSRDPRFEQMFRNLCGEVRQLMERADDYEGGNHDTTTFVLMYDNGEKEERTMSLPDETFTVCFTIVDQMVKSASGRM